MAEELKLQIGYQFANGPLKDVFEEQINYDQATIGGPNPGFDIIPSAAEQVIDFGDLASPALVFMKNLDDTNYVVFGPEDGGGMIDFGIVRPGGVAHFELQVGTVLRMQADTADVKMLIKAFEL